MEKCPFKPFATTVDNVKNDPVSLPPPPTPDPKGMPIFGAVRVVRGVENDTSGLPLFSMIDFPRLSPVFQTNFFQFSLTVFIVSGEFSPKCGTLTWWGGLSGLIKY